MKIFRGRVWNGQEVQALITECSLSYGMVLSARSVFFDLEVSLDKNY